jgi:hypothetical protein
VSGEGEKNLFFKNQTSGVSSLIGYSLDVNANGAAYIKKTVTGVPASSKMTADNVNVTDLCFIVKQVDGVGNINSTQCYPWRVTILMTVDAIPAGSSVSPVNLQTTVSSRVLPGELSRNEKFGTSAGNCAL